eukprot:Skav236101  [mRNA]  locus=scaffold1166:210767:211762:+ [translate_table: standard]
MPRKKKSAAATAPSEAAEPSEGWTRYFDPGAERTYLYCEKTGEWFFEEPGPSGPSGQESTTLPEPSAAQGEQVPIFGVSLQDRPSVPPTPVTPPAAPFDRESAVNLAKVDPIVQDLLRDELKLKKKLREIDALETASRVKQLEPMQLTKLSKKQSIMSDLQLVRDHIAEALEEFNSRRVPSQTSDVPRAVAPKLKAKQSQPVQGLNPLPQRGKAPMPINPRIADMRLGNSASRHPTLAGYSGTSATAQSGEGPGDPSGPSGPGPSPSQNTGTGNSQHRAQAKAVSQFPRAAAVSTIPDEDGFVAVRKGAKPKKAAGKGNSSVPAPDDDEFW